MSTLPCASHARRAHTRRHRESPGVETRDLESLPRWIGLTPVARINPSQSPIPNPQSPVSCLERAHEVDQGLDGRRLDGIVGRSADAADGAVTFQAEQALTL